MTSDVYVHVRHQDGVDAATVKRLAHAFSKDLDRPPVLEETPSPES